MAILGTNGRITLTDWAKSIDPDGTTADVAELLAQQNPIIDHMQWVEGNLPTGHQHTIRTGLPIPTWRLLYQGVPPTKSQRQQITDATGMLEARNEVDKDLATLNGNQADFMLQEAVAHLEAMNQAFTQTLIYGSTAANPERFTGLAARYPGLSGYAAASNVINAQGTTNLGVTSLWLVVWGPNTVFGIFPKGSVAGLIRQDLGEIDAFDASQNRFRALAERFQWKCGLSVRDWRYVVRICNIEVATLLAASGAADLVKLVIRAMGRIPAMGMGRPVLYGSRALHTALAIQALDKSQNAVAVQPAINQYGPITPGSAGTGQLTINGVPMYGVDSILDTEALVA